MRRAVILIWVTLLSGCGTSWIGQTSEAREQPRLEPLRIEDIARDAVALPNAERSIKFAIIGDSGRGSKEQHEVADQMAAYADAGADWIILGPIDSANPDNAAILGDARRLLHSAAP